MTGVPEWFFLLSVGLFGLLFGSMANVIIWRVPRGESIVSPGSHCPSCGMAIHWYDNIPILSYILLRGRCRGCSVGISIRYPLVELGSGILWIVAALTFGMSLRTISAIFLYYLLLVLAAIDLDTQRLPNVLVGFLALGGLAGILASELFRVEFLPIVGLSDSGLLSQPWAAALVGVVLGAGTTGGIGVVYGLLRGRQGMGMGDIKLLGALGLFLGPYTLMVLLLASVLGAVVGLIGGRGSMASGRKIPFGPFLAAAALIVTVAGPSIWAWYAALTGLA